jgi:hypothetical protein
MLRFRPESGPGGTGDGSTGDKTGESPAATNSSASQEDTTSTPPAGEADKGTTDDEKASLRKEAAKYRTERNALAKKVEELEGAQKSDVEKLTDRMSKLEGTNTSLEARNRSLKIQVLASQVGIVDPELAAMSLERQSDLDWEDDDAVEKALQKLVKDKPHLAGSIPGGSDGGAGTSRRPETQDMNTLIRQSAGRE